MSTPGLQGVQMPLFTRGSDDAMRLDTTNPPIPSPEGTNSCTVFIWDVMDIVMFAVGTLGNLLAFLVMRQRLSSTSYALSLSVLALFNSLTLFVLAFQAGDRLLNTKFNFRSIEAIIGHYGCKFYRIILHVVQGMSHYVVVFITTERFVAICFPMWLPTLFSTNKSKISLSVLFVVSVLTQMWRPYYDGQIPTQYENGTLVREAYCYAVPIGTYNNVDIYVQQLFLLLLLPAISILIMNTAVIVQVIRMSREVTKHGGVHRGRRPTKTNSSVVNSGSNTDVSKMSTTSRIEGQDDAGRRTRKTTILLLAISCSFFIYLCPSLGLMLYVRTYHLVYGMEKALPIFLQLCPVMKGAALLTYFSYADNIIVLTAAGGAFRREFQAMIFRWASACCPSLASKSLANKRISNQSPSVRNPSQKQTTTSDVSNKPLLHTNEHGRKASATSADEQPYKPN